MAAIWLLRSTTSYRGCLYWLIDICKYKNLFIVSGRVGKDKGVVSKYIRFGIHIVLKRMFRFSDTL